MYQARYFKDPYFNAIEIIRSAAEKHNLTIIEIALRWMIHHSQLDFANGDGVIIGCSSPEQLESNLTDFGKGPLPDEVVSALDVVPSHENVLTHRMLTVMSRVTFPITGTLPDIFKVCQAKNK
jgi:aryl-alcohol dehydrogenase-like predicted oxidoreductase